jgi:hypothetical protein
MLECQKRAIKKYVEKNRDKVNEYNRIRYNKFKENDEEKYQQILTSKKEYYHKRKAKKESEATYEVELEDAEIKENQEINLQ